MARTQKLTKLQTNFVRILDLVERGEADMSDAEAYQLAGSRSTGETLRVQAWKTKQLPYIQAALTRARRKRAKNVQMSKDRIIEEVEKAIRFIITDLMTWDKEGNINLNPSSAMMKDKLAVIKSVHVTKRQYKNKKGTPGTITNTRFEMYDKHNAIKILAALKGFTKDTGRDDAVLTLAQALVNANAKHPVEESDE